MYKVSYVTVENLKAPGLARRLLAGGGGGGAACGSGKGEESHGKGGSESDSRGPERLTGRTEAVGGFLEETRHDYICVLERQQRRQGEAQTGEKDQAGGPCGKLSPEAQWCAVWKWLWRRGRRGHEGQGCFRGSTAPGLTSFLTY